MKSMTKDVLKNLLKKNKDGLTDFFRLFGITDPDEVEAIERMFKPNKRVLNTGGANRDGYQGS